MLTIPAEAASIRLARLVAAGFASQLGATVADLDDLRTVVDEMCSLLVAQARSDDEITVRLMTSDGLLQATAAAPSRRPWQPDELSEAVVRVLADEYHVDHADGRVELVIRKSVQPASD
jgi:Histidine kinase-like ATPase domain